MAAGDERQKARTAVTMCRFRGLKGEFWVHLVHQVHTDLHIRSCCKVSRFHPPHDARRIVRVEIAACLSECCDIYKCVYTLRL